MNPAHMWALKGAIGPYASWMMGQYVSPKPSPTLPPMPAKLREHAEYAAQELQRRPIEISGVMRKHQLKLVDRQCRMSELSSRVQSLIVLLCTSLYGARQEDEVVQSAADIVCRDLRLQLSGKRPSDRYFRDTTSLGQSIVDGGFTSIAGLAPDEIMMPYDDA